jgi:hypothetical protein
MRRRGRGGCTYNFFLPKSNLMWLFSDRLFGWCKDKRERENLRFTRCRIEASWYPWSILPSLQSSAVSRRFQWPCGVTRGCAASLACWDWGFESTGGRDVCLECCVLSGSLCNGLITRPEASYRVWCVWVWSWSLGIAEALSHQGLSRHGKKKKLLAKFCVWLHVLFLGRTYFVGLKCFMI